MFIWAPLARHAKYARLGRVVLVFLAVQSMLSLPVLFLFMRTPPAVFYPRVHGGPYFGAFCSQWADEVAIIEDEIGFTKILEIPNDEAASFIGTDSRHIVRLAQLDAEGDVLNSGGGWLFVLTPHHIFYSDENTVMTVPVNLVPAWVLQEMNLAEVFNHLALYNSYFAGIVMPVFLLVFIVFFMSQAMLTVAAIWLFGQWRKFLGSMTVKERFSVITFASVPSGVLGAAAGFFLPVIHIFIFQLVTIYISYMAMKEF